MDYKKISESFKDYEDRLLVNELLDYGKACSSGYTWRHTDFLDPRQQKIAREITGLFEGVNCEFYGGIPDSERAVCILRSSDYQPTEEDNPVTVLSIAWNKNAGRLSHRDFLGSILGCGIKREKIGDIIISEYRAYAACMSDISRFILYNLDKVGNTSVSVSVADTVHNVEEKVKIISSTVASLRLDSIVAAGCGVSRAGASDMIKSGRVKINWEEVLSSSKEVKQGDAISIRGKGRIVLEEVAGKTKKDRIKITIRKYL